MNINNGKTGTVNIPGALHSTGGDGDGQVGNVVAYAGDIYDENLNANQAEINATINNVSNLPLTSINGHVGSFKNIPKEDSNVVEADETIALGVGVFADKQRSFGWGSGYQIIFLTGSNSQYTIRMNGNSSAKQPFVALATAWVGGYILTSGTTHRRVAKVTAGNFSNGVLTITTNTDLGTLNDAKYTYECKTGQQNFCAGAFINSGRQNIAIGTHNFASSDFSTTIGAMNGSTQNAKYSNTIGSWNNNDAKGTIVGNENILKTENSSIVGTENSITSNSHTPSSVLGYHNNIPSGHGALIGNDNTSSGDKGYALGEHNNLQYSGVALGQYNKDYTSNNDSEKNLFVVGNGTADNARSNSIEQKQNGTLFIKGVGGFDGTNSQSSSTKSLQDVLNEIASASTSGGVSSWNDLEDKPTILDSYDVRQIVLEKCPLHYDDNDNYVTFIPNGSNDSYTLNTVRNTYNGIVLGKYNSTSGNTSYRDDESTVIVGRGNTNASKNSVLIGDSNNNNQNKSVLLGSTNINKSEGGINIGFYNQNNGGERNVMVGYENYASNSASTLCMGSENEFSMHYNSPANQEIIAIGRGLACRTGGIFLGYYNVQDYILTGDTANFLTIGDGSGTTYSSTRSNIIEQRRNGDIYIKGIGNYNGNNSRRDPRDPTRGKSLQEVISGISASTESKLSQTPNNSLEFGLTNFVNNTSDSFAGGVGVNAKGDRAFGFGQTYMTVYVTGSGESDNNDEYPYSLMIGNPTGYTVQNAVAEEFAKTMVGAYLLDTTNNFHRYAIINSITYNGQNQPLSVKLDCSLGQKTNAVWTVENIGSGRTFSVGGYGNIGQYGVAMGNYAFNSGKNSIVMGQYNANGGQNSSVFGVYNHNSQTGGNLLGTQNTNTGQYSNVIGLQNTNSGQYANIIGRNNNNNCASTTIVGIANDVKETTYPSVIVGYNNSGDTSTQQFTLGNGNHGTRGQYAPDNVSFSWMIGRNLITSREGIAMGIYNKDYDVQDTDKQNFFVIGQGEANQPSNPFELKVNGDLYIQGVGGFDGTNSQSASTKSLQDVLNEIASASTSGGSDSNLTLDEDKNLLINEDYITVDGGDNLLYAIDYIGYNLSGSSSQYELELYGGYSWKNFHYQLVKFLEDAEILDEDGQTVATITDATYDSSTKNITITTSVDLGELHGNMFYSRNLNIADCCICLGGFLNKGYYANLIGRDNYNTGDDAIAIGNYNTNEGEGCVIVGNNNSIHDEHNGYRCYVFGEWNKVNDNSILYVLGKFNESTGDDLQSFGLGDGIKFTRGVNAGNDNLNQVGIGVGLDISQNEFVLGQFNKDYDIADNSQKNFFTVGNGNESTKSNSLEQKANGDLYVLGLGGFNGANSNINTTKSLQAKITELENRIAQLESLMSGGNS